MPRATLWLTSGLSPTRRVWVALAWWAGFLATGLGATALPASGGAPTLAAEQVGKGVYRFTGSQELPARAADLAAVVTAYAEQCRKGCRYQVDSVTRTEIVPADGPDHYFTWSYIDDVLDGSYFAEVYVQREPRRVEVQFSTPDAKTLGRLATAARPHEPFFFDQHGTWTLTELWDPAGRFLGTRVEVAIEMRSDRWVVNLLPGQILSRTQKHLAVMFGHLAAVPAAAAP